MTCSTFRQSEVAKYKKELEVISKVTPIVKPRLRLFGLKKSGLCPKVALFAGELGGQGSQALIPDMWPLWALYLALLRELSLVVLQRATHL